MKKIILLMALMVIFLLPVTAFNLGTKVGFGFLISTSTSKDIHPETGPLLASLFSDLYFKIPLTDTFFIIPEFGILINGISYSDSSAEYNDVTYIYEQVFVNSLLLFGFGEDIVENDTYKVNYLVSYGPALMYALAGRYDQKLDYPVYVADYEGTYYVHTEGDLDYGSGKEQLGRWSFLLAGGFDVEIEIRRDNLNTIGMIFGTRYMVEIIDQRFSHGGDDLVNMAIFATIGYYINF